MKEVIGQLGAASFDKRRLAKLSEHLDDLADDDDFWQVQANSLAVLVTPDTIRTYRLANNIKSTVQVSDRFHLNPLLRAITFPQSALILALSENAVRLVEVSSSLPARTVKIDALPKNAADSVGKSTLNKRGPSRRIQGSEGQNVRYAQYARRVDAALKPVVTGRNIPLILAATERLASVYRSICTDPNLLDGTIGGNPDQTTDAELADASRPLIDDHNQEVVNTFHTLFESRKAQNRSISDVSEVGKAATFGAVEWLLVDIDANIPGELDEVTGAVTIASDAKSYEVVNEIATRALANGAQVLAVRKTDIPEDKPLASILRFPIKKRTLLGFAHG